MPMNRNGRKYNLPDKQIGTFYFKVSKKKAFFNLNVEPVDFYERNKKMQCQ